MRHGDGALDHAAPSGETIELGVMVHRATDTSATKLGTVFFNPGGPSDAGTAFLPTFIDGFPEEVRQRFDIATWDPRGMGGSTTPIVQCFDTQDEEEELLAEQEPLPVTESDLAAYVELRTQFNAQCVERNGDLLAHVSTADNARDLDLLRQAMNVEQLDYYGTSYGTFLGATYLNMFPEHVRGVVLDGALFPTAWAELDASDPTLTTFLRAGSDLASAEVIQDFLTLCGEATIDQCPFSAGSADDTVDKYTELLARAKATPIEINGSPVDDRTIAGYLGGAIYIVEAVPGSARFQGWVGAAATLQQFWEASEGFDRQHVPDRTGEHPGQHCAGDQR